MTITKKQADDYADQTLDFVTAFIVKKPKATLVIFGVILAVVVFVMWG